MGLVRGTCALGQDNANNPLRITLRPDRRGNASSVQVLMQPEPHWVQYVCPEQTEHVTNRPSFPAANQVVKLTSA